MAKTQSHPVQLSDAQRTILTDAAARIDASIILPARLKGGAANKVVQALLDKGLVREVRAKGEQPVWRTDADTGRGFSLVVTKVGRALGTVPAAEAAMTATPAGSPDPAAPAAASSPTIPRPSSKLAAVIALLGREQGSSVPELMAATGWLPHTTRAALTGLRKRGYALLREAGEGGPVYRIGTDVAAAPEAAA